MPYFSKSQTSSKGKWRDPQTEEDKSEEHKSEESGDEVSLQSDSEEENIGKKMKDYNQNLMELTWLIIFSDNQW